MSAKLEIFDPLDRNIHQEDQEEENLAISRQDLLDELINMPAIKGSDLNIPLTNQLFIQFTALLDQEHKNCSNIA